MTSTKRTLHYVTDPMCSWCWGFSPVIDAMRKDYADVLEVKLVVGGLRVGTTEKMTDAIRDMVVHHWHEVHDLTGQEFCYDFRVPDTFLYDTEPACRALVSVRNTSRESTFPYLKAVHRAFYVENRDVTDTDVLATLAEEQNIDPESFRSTFESREIRQETLQDFAQAQSWGIRGFPAIVLEESSGYKLLTIGYQHFDALKPHLDSWLETSVATQ